MKFLIGFFTFFLLCGLGCARADDMKATSAYMLGVDDVLDINVLQPEKLNTTVTVSPDGSITFPYLGNVKAAGLSLADLQENIQRGLANGYMKYPVVSVTLRESRSRKFFVYGEVARPGTYPLDASATVLRGVTIAGGFNKFGSANVKVLRMRKGKPGYDTIKVNIKAIMNGASESDIVLEPGDIIVVSEGMF
jgi:polysaccharide biosynthesis/export protein